MYFSRVRVSRDIQKLSHLHHVLRGDGYGAHQLLWDLFSGKERTFLFREEIAGEQIPHYKGAKGEPIYYLVSQSEPAKKNPLFDVASKPYKPRLAVGDRLSFKLRANPTIARREAGKKNCTRHDVVMDVQYHQLRELAQAAGVDDSGKKSDLKERILDGLLTSKDQKITSKLETTIEGNERYRELLAQKHTSAKLFDLALKSATDSALEMWLTERGKANGFSIASDEKRNRLRFQAEGYRWHALPKKGKSAGFSSVDFDGEIVVTDSVLFEEALFTGIGPAKGFGCGLMLVRRV